MKNPYDPRGLIAEAFKMPDITVQDCRTIFLDWAISLDAEDPVESAKALAELYAGDHAGHPMVEVLKEAETPPRKRSRRRK